MKWRIVFNLVCPFHRIILEKADIVKKINLNLKNICVAKRTPVFRNIIFIMSLISLHDVLVSIF